MNFCFPYVSAAVEDNGIPLSGSCCAGRWFLLSDAFLLFFLGRGCSALYCGGCSGALAELAVH